MSTSTLINSTYPSQTTAPSSTLDSRKRLESLFQDRSHLPNIVFLGKPGAGKGTLSQMLSKRVGYVHLSIGDIHRHEKEKGTELGLQIRECVAKKDFFCPTMQRISRSILDQRLQKIQENHQLFILDNFPTSNVYLPYLYEVINKYHLANRTIVIVPEISDQETIERVSSRLVCSNPSCACIYNSSNRYAPKKLDTCDECGAKLIKRQDDPKTAAQETKVFQEKLNVFQQHIRPVIESIKADGKIETFIMDSSDLSEIFSRCLQPQSRSCASFYGKYKIYLLFFLLGCCTALFISTMKNRY